MKSPRLKFITTNRHKFKEVQEFLKPIKIKQLNIALDEIQDIDPHKIIKHKLKEAFKHHKGPFIIEDSWFGLEAMGRKLPGPFIKYFNQYIGPRDLAKLAIKLGKTKAKASVLIAFARNSKSIQFFEGGNKGRIVLPKGDYGFGYDPIFKPEGFSKTFAELKRLKDFSKSARGIASIKLKKYLLKNLK